MLLLDGCPLPQVQFASLSVLVQMRTHDGGDGPSDHLPPTILTKVSSEEIEPSGAVPPAPAPAAGVEAVECRTEDGGIKMVPLYPKGEAIYYRNASSGGTRTPATILEVHSDDFLEPYYTIRLDDGREKQTDNAHLRLGATSAEDSDGGGNPLGGGAAEVDRSAGPPAPRTPSRAVLVESMTVVSPLATLPEGACERGLDGLRRLVMEDLGMKDDFIAVGSGGEDGGNSGVIPSCDPVCEPEVESGDVVAVGEGGRERPGDGCKDSVSRGRVWFHDGTKEGTVQDTPPKATARPRSDPDQNHPFGSTMPVKAYRPPPHLLNFPIGITIFYVVAHVEDPSKFAKPDDSGADDGMARALRNCASVLLPGIALSSLAGADTCREGGGAVVLAAGVSGPAYDLFGASEPFATMPERLREGMGALAAVDTSPRAMASAHGVVAVSDYQPSASEGKKKKSKVGRKGSPSKLPASPAAHSQLSAITHQPPLYDAPYFRRLYEALLATLMDDEDGMMRDHDNVPLATTLPADDRVSQSYDHKLMSSSAAAEVGVGHFTARQRPGQTESTSGLLAGHSVTSSGTVKKKLFTFSRGRRSSKVKAKSGEYEFGASISGGDNSPVGGGGTVGDGSGSDHVEVVRRTAQRLELLSLVEDDMALPKFTRADDSKRGGAKRPLSSAAGRSPSARSKAGGHGHGVGPAPGRFGRPAAPSDLWGFDYRHPSQRPQHRTHGGASASGTASTSIMGVSASDDIVSVMSGDDSVTVGSKLTVGSASHSSVPTLSKSKRDSSSGGASSRSRFLRRKRREGKSAASGPATKGGIPGEEDVRLQSQAANAEAKPPLFPQQPLQTQRAQQQQPVYDPFSMEDDDVSSCNVEEDSKAEGSESLRDALASTRDSMRTPLTARTPQAPGTSSFASSASTVPVQDEVIRTPQTPAAPEEEEEEEGRLAPISPQRPDPSPAPSPTTAAKEVIGRQPVHAFAAAPAPPLSHRQVIANNIVQSYSRESGGGLPDGASLHEERESAAESVSESVASIATDGAQSADASPVPESPGSIKTEPESGAIAASTWAVVADKDDQTEAEITQYLDVGLALNEDLTCEYRKSKLSTLTVEGTVQVRVNTRHDRGPTEDQQGNPVPFLLVFKDYAGHIKALQENKRFVENVTQERGDVANREFTYTVRVPREDEYFPVVRYKCGSSLRPVPIRVQSRVRTQNKFCRVALQISSNPQNASDLVHLTIIMSVPDGVHGNTLQTNPPGGVWNESKRVVLWCVSELGGGEKFQLQSVFEMGEELLQDVPAEELEFPVLARCQCSGAQLSDVALEVTEVGGVFPAEVTMSLVQRFRVSHKESNL